MMKTIKLTFNQKELEFSLSIGFLGEILENWNVSVSEIDKKISDNPFKWFPIFLYESAKYSAEYNKREFDSTLYDYIDLIEQDGGVDSKNLVTFYKALMKSLTNHVPVEKDIKESKKK